MAGVDLCQCCLRENEEEVADLWCNYCNEAVCRNCGKAHRRFAVAHDVIPLKNASACRKKIPQNCLLHENKKLIMFCVGHDQLICHECLSKSHRRCNKTLEIEKAAEGIKDSAAIKDLKERMTKLTSIIEKTQTENEDQMSKIRAEKESAKGHIKEFLQCFKDHLILVENNLNEKYKTIVIQNTENGNQLQSIRQGLQENIEWLYMLESSTSEINIFNAVKHLDTIQVTSEKKIDKIKKDSKTLPLDELPVDGTNYIDKFFRKLSEKTKRKLKLDVMFSDGKCLQSQNIVEEVKILDPIPRYQELMTDYNSTFGALCFTGDGRLVVEESKVCPSTSGRSSSKTIIRCLRIFDLQTTQSTQIPLPEISDTIDMNTGSICMFDKDLALLATSKVMRGILVIDIGLKRHCRTIYLQGAKIDRIGIEFVKWVTCKGGKIFFLTICKTYSWLCSIDFNGTILSTFCISGSVADMTFDGSQRFFHTYNRANDIHCTLSGQIWLTRKCYSCLDLTEGCGILHIGGDELLLLEKSSNMVYKLDVKYQNRSILIKNDIVNPTHFNFSYQIKKIAVTMNGGKCIRIFPY